MKKVMVIVLLLLSINVNAQTIGLTDKAAHFGVSYALTTFSYGVFHKELKLNRTQALISAATTVFILGFLKECADSAGKGSSDFGDVLANGLGAGAAVSTMLIFKF